MSRVYIHEVVEVDGTRRAEYQHHMTANWVPEAAELRRQRCFGVFSLVGSTGPWPRVVNIWEYESWHDLGHNFSVELTGARHRDPMLERWWREAAEFRRGGFDRLLVAHDGSPGVEYWHARGGTGSVGYLHEVLRTRPGGAPDLAARLSDATVSEQGGPVDPRSFGLELVGTWRTAMRADDEVVVLWAVPGWDDWAELEARRNEPAAGRDPEVTSREAWLLVDAELSPLRTGRQPAESDRRPYGEI